MRAVPMLLPLVLGGCGPELILVDLSFTIANDSGYDMASAAVCVNDGLDEECGDAFSIEDGAMGTTSSIVYVYEEDSFTVNAAAIDVQGDGYVWGPRTYVVSGPALDVSVVFTQDECCYDF